ncbi:Thioredoxin [Phytophthora megakarya]|uniref:Thioredoxin n=1 Tax=Phytophthora megakarya TaxID=4795 RepID=A0A225WST9_9STRA|nr:Thioredoxin [Phytophthora megakarya]
MLTIASAEDFHSAVASATEKPLVACFSAPWCGGCKLVAPKVEELAEELKESVAFAKVSAEELNALCEEVEVESFPHFRVYKEGKILGDYTSSKFDKVDTFVRGLVAPETLKSEETPEGDAKEATEKTGTEKEVEGSKKRQEREEMEENDEHVAKKTKEEPKEATEETEMDAPAETEKAEEAEEATENGEKVVETTEKAVETEKETEKEVASVEKGEKADADAPVDPVAA